MLLSGWLREKNMMLKFVVMLLMVLSVACSHVEKQKDIDQNKVVQPVKTIEEPVNKPKPVDLEPEEKPVEPSQLDADLLFSLLSGEVAGQRGNIRMASAFYLDAAKRSGDSEVALRAAQIALYNKDLVSAESAIDILVEEGDLQLSSHRLALTIYLHAAEVEKSLNQVDSILKKSDVSPRNTVLSIGDLVARNASKEVATSVMNDLVARFPEKASVYLARSRVMSHFAELEQAKKDAVKATKIDSSWPAGFAQLALVLDGQGEIDQALLVLKQAAEQLEVRQLVMVYGRLLAKNEHYEEAKKQFLRLLSDGSSDPEASFALGLVYLKLEEAAKAAKIFEKLYEEKAFPSKSAFYLGRIHYYQKQYKDALLWFGRVDKGNHYIDSQASIAMLEAEVGNLQSARSILQRLRNEYPTNSARFFLLEAELLMDSQQHSVLYDLLTGAIAESPDNLSFRYLRSIAATELDKIKVAEKDLLFILEREPDNANALNALGYTLASKTFRFKEAREYLTKALALKPNDSAILDSVGWLNYREGQYEKALIFLQKAYSQSPDGEIAAHLGETLWMLGRQHEARQLWQEALKRDKDNRHLIEVLKRLK